MWKRMGDGWWQFCGVWKKPEEVELNNEQLKALERISKKYAPRTMD